MNIKHQFTFLYVLILLFLSCASVKNVEKTDSLLPMKTGWYLYDFEYTFKAIEEEYNQSFITKMKVVQELAWKYTGVVCRFEDGVLFDPVMGIELSINSEGNIGCAENISIKGTLENDGHFFWSGVKEEYKRLNSIFVRGTLRPLPDTAAGNTEYDGVYHMIDARTKREQLVNIKNGFYTWKYLDGRDAGFTPWPLLVRSDGSVICGMEITTVMVMGNLSNVNYTTSFSLKGKIVSGQGISMEEVPLSSGAAREQKDAVLNYTGTIIQTGEYPNEAIPLDIENLVKAGRAAIKKEPKPNIAKYPSWYLKLPEKPGFIYAAGEKTSTVKKTAFAIAEAAASSLAEQTRIYTEISNNSKTITDKRAKSEPPQSLNYKIIEQFYNEEIHTAFVLVEMSLK